MNLIDLLLQLQIPLWVVLLLSILGIIGVRYYTYKLDQARETSSKQLEHALAIQKMEYEKTLELIQERYRGRLDAIDKVNAALWQFDHALRHVRVGDAGLGDFDSLRENYSLARKLAREYESLLGSDFYKLVERQTTEGIKILDATLSITQEKLDQLKDSGISEETLKTLLLFADKPILITKIRDFSTNNDYKAVRLWLEYILQMSPLTSEFNDHMYNITKIRLEKQIQAMLRIPPLSVKSQ